MYAGIGRANSTNSGSHDHEINADIPEWKKLLIMKKRASCANSNNGVEESKPPAVDASRPHSISPVITPVKAASSPRVITSGTCDLPNSFAGNKFARSAKAEVETEKVVIPFSISAGETTILASNAVTRIFGNINVELRSVHRATSVSLDVSVESPKIDALPTARFLLSPSSEPPMPRGSDEEREDLQYGPGIVDKLRSRFLNMGLKNERKPVVRRFSSLENLSDRSNGVGPFRATERESRGERKLFVGNGAPNSSNHISGKVKKAQSMETLLVASPEQHVFSGSKASRRFAAPCNAYRTGLRSQSRNNPSPIPILANENTDHESKGTLLRNQNGVESVQRGSKINTKREFGRQVVSAPYINEEELPKPDTVKHFKKIFESPPANYNSCSVMLSNKTNSNTRKAATPTPPTSVGKILSSAITPSVQEKIPPMIKCPKVKDFLAKSSAKANTDDISSPSSVNTDSIHHDSDPRDCENDPTANNNEHVDSKALSAAKEGDEGNIGGNGLSPLEINPSALSPLSCESEISTEIAECQSPGPIVSSSSGESSDEEYSASHYSSKLQQVPFDLSPPLSPEVVCEQLPEAPTPEEREPTQGSRPSEPEHNLNTRPHPEADLPSHGDGMVVASREGASSDPDGGSEMGLSGSPTGDDVVGLRPSAILAARKAPSWQKPPASTTSVVFDFRGKDVKPNISLKPAPFGCRPAKVPRSKKRSGSPPRSGLIKTNGISRGAEDYSDDEEDTFDELDVGADLPILSGVVFSGENVKIGKGSLLATRNKNLTIQFNDSATSTYEYPSEASVVDEFSPTSSEESSIGTNANDLPSLKSHIPLGPSGLSSYTPNVLSSNGDYEFGVSRLSYRHVSPTEQSALLPPTAPPSSDDIVPADPEDISGWSATETSDILF